MVGTCAGRSTGPGVFRAEQATVAPSQSGAIHVRFRLQLITGPGSTQPPFADVALVLEAGSLRATATGARVATAGRNDLDVPGPIK